jgi:hypothetical protein
LLRFADSQFIGQVATKQMGSQKNDFHIIVLDRPVDRRLVLCVIGYVSTHRAEIAHVKPAFKDVKLNRGHAMASERNAPPFWSILKSERY